MCEGDSYGHLVYIRFRRPDSVEHHLRLVPEYVCFSRQNGNHQD